MTQTPARHIDRFADLPVLVLGEAMLDSYLEGAASRLCPEAPVPVVALTGRRDAAGRGRQYRRERPPPRGAGGLALRGRGRRRGAACCAIAWRARGRRRNTC